MDNSYFIFTDRTQNIKIKRLHNCIWEFGNNTSLIEFGFEIDETCLEAIDELNLNIHIPWLNDKDTFEDLYPRLIVPSNSKFIFNDSVELIKPLNNS